MSIYKDFIRDIKGIYRDYLRDIKGLYRDNGKENGSYYVGFRV